MNKQPHRADPTIHRRTAPLDFEIDDDFFDLPPYQVHEAQEKQQKEEKQASSVPPRRSRAPLSRPSWSRLLPNLLTFLIVLIFTAVVILLAHSAIDDPTQGTESPSTDDPSSQPSEDPTTPEDPTPALPENPPVNDYTYAADVSAYMDAIEYAPAKDDILLLNKQNPKPNYAPEVLVALNSSDTLYGKSVDLEITTAAALQAMLLCMRADGIRDTYVTSGYRSYTYQAQLFAFYIQQEMSKDSTLTRDAATAIVETYSARPGYSEHQSGLCVDLMTTTMGNLDESFEKTAAFAWLQENAAQFGFILRYPKGKESITGYTYEPWHYRFVGRSVALAIQSSGLTLEEYLGQSAPQ